MSVAAFQGGYSQKQTGGCAWHPGQSLRPLVTSVCTQDFGCVLFSLLTVLTLDKDALQTVLQ